MAEGLHSTALVISTRIGGDVRERRVEGEALTLDAVAAAVAALDGGQRNDLCLESAGAAAMVVAGGPELCFIYATFDAEAFVVPDSDREGGPVELLAGGQLGTFPAESLVDTATAVAIATTWARDGELDPRVRWRES
jgi:hypothetical protein